MDTYFLFLLFLVVFFSFDDAIKLGYGLWVNLSRRTDLSKRYLYTKKKKSLKYMYNKTLWKNKLYSAQWKWRLFEFTTMYSWSQKFTYILQNLQHVDYFTK